MVLGGIAVLMLAVMSGCSEQAMMMAPLQAEAKSVAYYESEYSHSETTVAKEVSVEAPEVEAVAAEVAEARGRLVVYNAVLNVVVERVSDSLVEIRRTVTQMGGYMHTMSNDSITMKVPAGRFHEAVDEIARLGEVTHRDIKGADVTAKMRDLKIRLDNAEQTRGRLIKLLDRAGKMEDAIKIEKELERITEKIELLKGQIAVLSNDVSYSTITVNLNRKRPVRDIRVGTPFYWLHSLGAGLTQTDTGFPYESSSLWGSDVFELPEDYIKYYQDKSRTKAMSAAKVMIDLHKETNYKGGSVKFWGELVRRVLVEEKAFSIKDSKRLTLRNKVEVVTHGGVKQIGTKMKGYLVGIAVTKKYVYVFECWGPIEEFEKDAAKLTKAIESMRVR
jgi:hypothetical protein